MAVSGKQGLFSYNGQPVDSMNQASADVNVDMRDHTSFTTGTVFFRTMKPGLASGTFSVSGFWDTASTDQNDMITNALAGTGDAARVEVDKDAGGGVTSSTAYINSFSLAASVDGDSTISFGLTAGSSVTYSTST